MGAGDYFQGIVQHGKRNKIHYTKIYSNYSNLFLNFAIIYFDCHRGNFCNDWLFVHQNNGYLVWRLEALNTTDEWITNVYCKFCFYQLLNALIQVQKLESCNILPQLIDQATNGYNCTSSRNTFIFNKRDSFPHPNFIGALALYANKDKKF